MEAAGGRAGLAALGIVLCLAGATAHADSGAPPNYLGAMGSAIFTDSARGTDDGAGWHLLYGSPLNERLSLELNLFGHRAALQALDRYDYAVGAGVDMRYLAGSPRLGVFALGGLGSIWEDFVNEEALSPYLNVGVGLQTGGEALKLRAESRYYAIFNNDTYAGESVLYDARLSLGLAYAFGAAAPEPVVDGDRDNDGVADSKDRCPATPPGTAVDADGCPLLQPDADGDGVPDASDRCPDTASGVAVGPDGCPLDEDGDGVVDAQDACPRTPPGFKVDARGCVVEEQTVIVLESVHFEFDSAKLTRDARVLLDRVAAGLRGQPDLRIEIVGHTDALGTESYNLQLSLARARAVRQFLLDLDTAPERLRAEGYGELHPIADNETEEGRARNRRVEFRVLTH